MCVNHLTAPGPLHHGNVKIHLIELYGGPGSATERHVRGGQTESIWSKSLHGRLLAFHTSQRCCEERCWKWICSEIPQTSIPQRPTSGLLLHGMCCRRHTVQQMCQKCAKTHLKNSLISVRLDQTDQIILWSYIFKPSCRFSRKLRSWLWLDRCNTWLWVMQLYLWLNVLGLCDGRWLQLQE